MKRSAGLADHQQTDLNQHDHFPGDVSALVKYYNNLKRSEGLAGHQQTDLNQHDYFPGDVSALVN